MNIKKIIIIAVFFLVNIFRSQVSSFDDLVVEEDSITSPYQPSGTFVYFKSKKKPGGMEKVPELNPVLSGNHEITDIVLVYTEDSPADLASREMDNRNRWDNLISAHPELFQFNSNYKSILQKASASNSEAMKNVQGFYVYYSKPAPPPQPAPVPMTKGDIKKGTEPPNETFTSSADEPKKKDKKKKEKEDVVNSEAKSESKKDKKRSAKEEDIVKTEKTPEKISPEPAPEPVKPVRTAPSYTTPKKAKDPKSCRPPCYEEGDEGLINYFKSALALSKKERKKFSDVTPSVKLTLEFNGSVKKTLITCPDKDLQGRIEQALAGMGYWLPAVKNGITVKSEVRFLLKYDKNTHAFLPSDFQIIPRPNPKCNKCMSDAEIFGE